MNTLNLSSEQMVKFRGKIFADGAIDALKELADEFYIKLDFENHTVTAAVPDVLIMMAHEIKRLRAEKVIQP